ncbi:MAG: hypothetical protein WC637_12525 [Victivallales bacterium]|jgi:hypothetical protein
MKIIRLTMAAALLFSSAAFFSSCKSEDNVKMAYVKHVDHFPKIKDYNVEFDCVSPRRTFKISEPAVLVFRLTNLSDKKLVVYEWMMLDDYNIKLFVAPWKEGTPPPEQDKWVCITPPVKKPARRMTLELTRNTSTIVEKTIDFKKDVIKKDIGNPQTFIVYAELNLESLPIKSRPAIITVNPGSPD